VRGILERFDGWQRRHAIAAVPIAVAKKYGTDRVANLAALVAFYAFFSLFPLLLAFTSILGFVLDDNPELRADVVDSALAQIPVIGPQLGDQVQPLSGSGVALAVGLIGALWAGLGVTLALGRAFAAIWNVPRLEQLNGVKARLRGLAVLAVLGVTLIASTAVTGLAIGGGIGPGAQRVAAVLVSLLVNAISLLATFALLSVRPRHPRSVLPGVALAAVGLLGMQTLGGWYVELTVSGASATYGTFALVIGLLSWLLLGANLLLAAAEINVVLRRRLWPRALTGELEPADRAALRQAAEATRGDRRQHIAVTFHDDLPEP